MSDPSDPGARVVEVLEALGAPYELIACDPELADTAAFCERYGVPPDHSGNCIIVASRGEPRQFCACLVLSTNRLDVNGVVRRLMGVRKASFASAEDTAALTGMIVGGVTPFALPPDLPLYVDGRVLDLDWVIVGGGSRSQKVRIAPRVIAHLPRAEVIDGLGM